MGNGFLSPVSFHPHTRLAAAAHDLGAVGPHAPETLFIILASSESRNKVPDHQAYAAVGSGMYLLYILIERSFLGPLYFHLEGIRYRAIASRCCVQGVSSLSVVFFSTYTFRLYLATSAPRGLAAMMRVATSCTTQALVLTLSAQGSMEFVVGSLGFGPPVLIDQFDPEIIAAP